jgi:hypothetical protein
VWEVKDPLLAPGATSDYPEEDTASNYNGGPAASLVGGISGGQMYGNAKGGYGGGGYGGQPGYGQAQGQGRGYPPSGERY